jgi:cobalamin transport system substrate-binding protein
MGKRQFLSVLAVIVLSACGGGGSGGTPPPTQTASTQAVFPVTLHAANGDVRIAHRPAHIISLSPTATEILYAIGAGSQVAAVDELSNYPPSAPVTTLSGFQPNVEAIAGFSPDLVIAAEDAGGLVHGLQGLTIPVIIAPAADDLAASYTQIAELGAATGHPDKANALVQQMTMQIGAILAGVPKPAHLISVYHELDSTFFSATSQTFIGHVYTLLGLSNIADGASASVHDYPQLSAEYIIQASPGLIVLGDTKCCQQTVASVSARAGWNTIAAVRSGQVVLADDDIASRWGPRIVDFIRIVAQHVVAIEQRQ